MHFTSIENLSELMVCECNSWWLLCCCYDQWDTSEILKQQ